MLLRRFAVSFFFLAALFLVPNASHLVAQTATGSILGTVKDSSGGVLAGVTITITSKGTGTTRSATSSEA